ncbi:MAG: hypothetical protein HYS70_02115 [Nitrospinae bacterium]|nr:hypothetical protein [Nitrospinota bacterium]
MRPVSASRHSPIGILGAMPEETEPFLETLEGSQSQPEGRFRFHRGTYGDREAIECYELP